ARASIRHQRVTRPVLSRRRRLRIHRIRAPSRHREYRGEVFHPDPCESVRDCPELERIQFPQQSMLSSRPHAQPRKGARGMSGRSWVFRSVLETKTGMSEILLVSARFYPSLGLRGETK